MRVLADGFTFEFPGALDAFVFDQQDKSQPHFHGLSHAMKAVDLIVELSEVTLFIEMKDFEAAPGDHAFSAVASREHQKTIHNLCNSLTQKFRDTWLYRWAERPMGSLDKPVYYLCLVTLENALLEPVQKVLRQRLPWNRPGLAPGPRWQRRIAEVCLVLNFERWESSFPAWPLHRSKKR